MRKNSRSHTKATGGNETTPQKKAQVLTKLAKLGLESATRSRAPKEPRDYEEIEIFLDSESETEEVPPRKSPKKDKKQTAGSPPGKQDGMQPRDVQRKTPKKTPKKPPRKAPKEACLQSGRKLRACTEAPRALPEEPKPSTSKKEDQSPEEKPAQIEDKPIQIEKALRIEEKPVQIEKPIQIEEKAVVAPQPRNLRAELRTVLLALAERLADPAGGAPPSMPLRPSLLKVQEWLVRGLSTVVERTGQNASMLVLGGRGIGKTMAVERAVLDLQEKYNVSSTATRVAIVRLSGLVHTEEQVAFRAIARQLCKAFGLDFVKGASTYDNLDFLLEMLREAFRAEKAVVVLLDEWDLFAKQPKQTVLYNLLEACNAKDMQVAVVGLSCRLQAEEMLEKRLRSRFSNSWKFVAAASIADFESAEESPVAVLREMLTLEPAEIPDAAPDFVSEFNAGSKAAVADPSLTAALRLLCEKGCCTPRNLKELAQIALSRCSMEGTVMSARHLLFAVNAVNNLAKGIADAISDLSVLELFLLVALDRLRRKGKDSLNFEKAFDEYGSLRRGGSYRGVDNTAPRLHALRSFDRLLSMSLLTYLDGRTRYKGDLREYAPVTLSPLHEEIQEGVKRNKSAPAMLSDWLDREIASTQHIEC